MSRKRLVVVLAIALSAIILVGCDWPVLNGSFTFDPGKGQLNVGWTPVASTGSAPAAAAGTVVPAGGPVGTSTPTKPATVAAGTALPVGGPITATVTITTVAVLPVAGGTPAGTPTPTSTAQPTVDTPTEDQCKLSFYDDTNRHGSLTHTWTVDLRANQISIVGGFSVDGVSNGVYRAVQGPAKVTVKVTDGFVLIIDEKCANREWCFRLSQAKQNGWAHSNVMPLPGWKPCQ